MPHVRNQKAMKGTKAEVTGHMTNPAEQSTNKWLHDQDGRKLRNMKNAIGQMNKVAEIKPKKSAEARDFQHDPEVIRS